jgi:tetratricopeptide (TPR) repeat protein
MIRSAKALLFVVSLASASFAQTPAQTAQAPDNKAGAYYNFAMGRVYAELAAAYGNRPDYVSKAIQHYQEALKLDPAAGIIFEALTDLYIQNNRLRDAVDQAEDLLKQNPDNLEARRMLGRIYTRMVSNPQNGRMDEGYLRKAIEQYQKVTAKDPKDAESWVMLGRLHHVSRDSVEAEKAFNEALKAEPDNEDALYNLAMLYSDLGDTKRAVEKLKAAADKNPNERMLASLASFYEQLRDFKSAAQSLRRALELAPDNPRLLRGLAEDLLRSDQLDEALRLYQQLARDNPRDAQLRLRISQVYRFQRDFAKAREELNKTKALDPEDMDARLEDTSLLEAEGKTGEAVTALKALLDETARENYSAAEAANRVTLLERLGTLYEKSKRYTEMAKALDDAEKLAAAKEDKETVHFMRGAMYERTKKYDAAEAEFRKVIELNPENAGALNYLGYMFADRAVKLDEAFQLIKKALDLDPDNGAYLDSMGWVYFRQGKLNEAEGLLVRAIDRIGQDPTVRDHLGDVYFQLGKTKDAINQWQASLKEFGTGAQPDTDPEEIAKVSKKLDAARVRLARETSQK